MPNEKVEQPVKINGKPVYVAPTLNSASIAIETRDSVFVATRTARRLEDGTQAIAELKIVDLTGWT